MINPLENPEISRRELGQGLVEYAAIVAGLSLAGVAALGPIGNAIGDKFGEAEEALGGKEEKPDEPLVGEAYALFCADDGSLTFVRSETPIADGDVYDGKAVANSYTGFETESYDYKTIPWEANQADVISVSFKEEIRPVSTAYWFYDMENCTSADLAKLDTSNATNMNSMFSGCSALISLDLSGFDTSNVTDMAGLFAQCHSLKALNVSSFNTSKVTNMGMMFGGCRGLTSLDVSGFDTSNVTNMSCMFGDPTNSYAGSTLNVSNFKTDKVVNMRQMFMRCYRLTSLDLSGFDTSSVTDMSSMFYGCGSLSSVDLKSFKTENVTNMNRMFWWCGNLSSVDMSSFDVLQTKNMSSMFALCTSLKVLNLPANVANSLAVIEGAEEGGKGVSNMFENDTALKNAGGIPDWYVGTYAVV